MTDLRDVNYLRETLDNLAASTWHKVEIGPQRGLKFGEESITDHNLFELDRHCTGVEIYKFNHNEEAGNGADFEWFIGDDADGWIAMRFQAKVLQDGSYRHLGHQVDGEMQYDRLLRRAEVDNFWPFYCFYNGWSGGWPRNVQNRVCARDFKPTLSGRSGGCAHANLEDFGCALVPAGLVALRHSSPPRRGRLKLDDYLGCSRPWSHLFRTPAPAAEIDDKADAFLDRLQWSLFWWTNLSRDEQLTGTDRRQGVPYGGGRWPLLPDWLAAVRAKEPLSAGARRPRWAVVVNLAAVDAARVE